LIITDLKGVYNKASTLDAFQFPGEELAKEGNPQFAAFPLELKRTPYNFDIQGNRQTKSRLRQLTKLRQLPGNPKAVLIAANHPRLLDKNRFIFYTENAYKYIFMTYTTPAPLFSS
jgi:hypothetical protein